MADPPDSKPGGEVLSRLPSSRPQRASSRRAGKRPAEGDVTPRKPRAAAASSKRAQAKRTTTAAAMGGARSAGDPTPKAVRPSMATNRVRSADPQSPASRAQPRKAQRPPEGVRLVGTAAQAAGELAQIGLSVGVKAVRGALSRLPRP